MVHKNNKKNRRRVAFYEISKFDYEAKKKLAKEQPLPKETPMKEKAVKSSSGNT